MRLLAIAAILISSACGGDDGASTGFADAVDDFVLAACDEAATCTGDDPTDCEADVRTDLADAEAALDATGEAQCIACLDAKATQLRAWADAACDDGALDEAAVYEVCDLDPVVDYDGDGTADNDDDEACAGFP